MIHKIIPGYVKQTYDDQGRIVSQAFFNKGHQRFTDDLGTRIQKPDALEEYLPRMQQAQHHCPQFTCPQCGSHRLEEIMIDVVQASEIVEVNSDGSLSYGDSTPDGAICGEVQRYQCLNCGLELPCDPNSESLAEYLDVE